MLTFLSLLITGLIFAVLTLYTTMIVDSIQYLQICRHASALCDVNWWLFLLTGGSSVFVIFYDVRLVVPQEQLLEALLTEFLSQCCLVVIGIVLYQHAATPSSYTKYVSGSTRQTTEV